MGDHLVTVHTARGALRVMVIVLGNEIGDLSSNPGRGWRSLLIDALEKGINPTVLSPPSHA